MKSGVGGGLDFGDLFFIYKASRLVFILCKGLFTIYVYKTDRQHPYTVFRVERITFFLVNRVENQNGPKQPQIGGRLGSFCF